MSRFGSSVIETNATEVPQSFASLRTFWMRTIDWVVAGQTPVHVV